MTAQTVSHLSTAIELDERPARWRIGLIALATDHTLERDLANICAGDDIGAYVTRVAFDNPMTRESLVAMGPRLTEAARLILPDEELDAVAYGCTSASVAMVLNTNWVAYICPWGWGFETPTASPLFSNIKT